MSTNLSAPALVGGQANPETTVNDAVGALDAALTEKVVVDLTLDATITSAVYTRCVRISVTPSGVGKTLTLQASKKMTLISNDSANSITLKVGTTTAALAVGALALVYTDGTANGLTVAALASGTVVQPHDLHLYIPGTYTASQVVMRFNVVRAFTLPASLTGSVFNAGTASTANSSFTIKRNGTSIGTIAFNISATGAATFAAAVTFAVNDIITIEAPAAADATLANVSLDFFGTR